ncbi:MAG: hypothetical protein ACTHJ6_01540 [Oryzihumus sp.]
MLRPRFWGAGPTFALVILQAAVFAASGCLLAPFDISHPGGPGSAWASGLPESPAPPPWVLAPPSVIAQPDRPSHGEQVRAGVARPVTTALRTSGSSTLSGAPSRASSVSAALPAAPRQTGIIVPVGFTVPPAALTPRRPVPVTGPTAAHVLPTTAKAHPTPRHHHRAHHRARVHQDRRGALLARVTRTHTRHGATTPPGAARRQPC